ncbi:MAG TPA: S9 family peptidase [Acidimicrobiales bacterium]|nr:S9 family peptidase [Acidimicrobiales bacterium]
MATPELIPLDVLFGNPDKSSPRISPDGRRLAYIAPHEGVLNVWLGTVGSDDFKPITADRDRGVRQFNWCHDNRTILYPQDTGGDENFRINSVNTDGGAVVDRTPFEGVQAQILALSKEKPDEVVIGINKDNPQLHDAYVLTLSTGNLEKVAENPGFIQWAIDNQLNVRGGAAPREDGGFDFHIDDKLVLSVDMEDGLSTDIVGFTKDGTGMYVQTSAGANATRLFVLDLASGEQKMIAEDPVYDVAMTVLHPDTREVQLVAFEEDRLRYQVLDPSIQEDIDALQRLHHGDLVLQGRDHADRTWLAAFTTDDGPIPYFAWDRETKEATFLFDHRPELGSYQLAKMEAFEFTARDGLVVHGYVSFPPGEEHSNLPTVLNVHGGPWARDTWGFNPEAQWFANRGYACVQVNYRGSTGYGKEFVNAGNREWGAKMHDDLIDAVEFIVKQGWADRDRIAIYGGSYGGYAALVGATFTPDVFCCAVDIVGPSNIKTLIESIPPYWAPLVVQFHTRVGNPETEEEFLWSRSPLSKVDQIRIPMLIAQGANDPRVKQAESEQIVAAMKANGIDHEYMLFPDEGHGFAKPENRMKFYAAAEHFLAQHLGGREGPVEQGRG